MARFLKSMTGGQSATADFPRFLHHGNKSTVVAAATSGATCMLYWPKNTWAM
jgi:hypothetical protein